MDSVTIRLPLPPRELGKNGSHGTWHGHHRAVQNHLTLATYALRQALPRDHAPWTGPVAVQVRWFGRGGPMPDTDNIIGRVSVAYQDAAQHAGLLVDDRQITGYTVERGYDRDDPRVELVFTRALGEEV